MKSVLLKVSGILIFGLLLSCGSKKKEVEKLQAETIEIHDEVMPKMDDIMKLKKSLKSKQDSVSSEESERIQALIVSLEKADEAMMNWMRNYDPKMEDMSEADKLEYLKNQKAAISDVSEQMKGSISKAKSYLNP